MTRWSFCWSYGLCIRYWLDNAVLYTVSTKSALPLHVSKCSKLASFVQSQFKSMNICLFSIKLPILVKSVSLSFGYWHLINGLQKFTISRIVLSYLLPWSWLWRQHWHNCHASKTKANWCSIVKILFWLKFFVKKKVITVDEWSHCFIGDNYERVVCVVTETCVSDV